MSRRKKYKDPNQSSLTVFFDADAFMNDIKEVIANSIIEKNRSATGKAVNSLEVIRNSDDEFQILAVPYLDKIQKGNPPRKSKRSTMGKSRYMTAPEFAIASSLQQGWLQSRGLPDELAFPIAKSIVSKGDLTYQKGGEDVWESNVNSFIDQHWDEYLNLEQFLNFDIL